MMQDDNTYCCVKRSCHAVLACKNEIWRWCLFLHPRNSKNRIFAAAIAAIASCSLLRSSDPKKNPFQCCYYCGHASLQCYWSRRSISTAERTYWSRRSISTAFLLPVRPFTTRALYWSRRSISTAPPTGAGDQFLLRASRLVLEQEINFYYVLRAQYWSRRSISTTRRFKAPFLPPQFRN